MDVVFTPNQKPAAMSSLQTGTLQTFEKKVVEAVIDGEKCKFTLDVKLDFLESEENYMNSSPWSFDNFVVHERCLKQVQDGAAGKGDLKPESIRALCRIRQSELQFSRELMRKYREQWGKFLNTPEDLKIAITCVRLEYLHRN